MHGPNCYSNCYSYSYGQVKERVFDAAECVVFATLAVVSLSNLQHTLPSVDVRFNQDAKHRRA